MIRDYRPFRRWMHSYAVEHGLRIPAGFTVETNEPLQSVGRGFLLRIQKHLHAAHPKAFPAKYVDGTFNEPTQIIAVPPLSMGQKALNFAMLELGVHESGGANRGPRVHEYQAVTRAYNTFWCASFFWWAWRQAGYEGAVSAGAWDSTDHHGQRLTLRQAKVGAGVSFNIGNGHIGMFIALVGNDVKTVDGNTSDEVAVRLRPISEIHSICMPR